MKTAVDKRQFIEIEWTNPEMIEDRNELVLRSLPIIDKIVRKLIDNTRFLHKHINEHDLFQQGVVSAIVAIERFRPKNNFDESFSGYVGFCIKRDLIWYLFKNNRTTSCAGGRGYKKKFWKDYSMAEKVAYLDSDKDEEYARVSAAVNLAVAKKWFADSRGQHEVSDYNSYIENCLSDANLSDLDREILDKYFGLSGVALQIGEIAKSLKVGKLKVARHLEGSLRKLRAHSYNRDDFKEVNAAKADILDFLVKIGISEIGIFCLKKFYGLGEDWASASAKEIGLARGIALGYVYATICNSRKMLWRHDGPALQNIIRRTRALVMALIGNLNLGLFHRNALKNFYCLEGDFVFVKMPPQNSLVKFKSSLGPIVGLARLSRDLENLRPR